MLIATFHVIVQPRVHISSVDVPGGRAEAIQKHSSEVLQNTGHSIRIGLYKICEFLGYDLKVCPDNGDRQKGEGHHFPYH